MLVINLMSFFQHVEEMELRIKAVRDISDVPCCGPAFVEKLTGNTILRMGNIAESLRK
jgi:hypothetical protein